MHQVYQEAVRVWNCWQCSKTIFEMVRFWQKGLNFTSIRTPMRVGFPEIWQLTLHLSLRFISGPQAPLCLLVRKDFSPCHPLRSDRPMTNTFRQQTLAFRASMSHCILLNRFSNRSCYSPLRPKILVLCRVSKVCIAVVYFTRLFFVDFPFVYKSLWKSMLSCSPCWYFND